MRALDAAARIFLLVTGHILYKRFIPFYYLMRADEGNRKNTVFSSA